MKKKYKLYDGKRAVASKSKVLAMLKEYPMF